MLRRFRRKSLAEEIEILSSDDIYLSATRAYLDDLILDTLDLFELNPSQREQIQTRMHQVVPRAARAYKENKRHLYGTKFSLYFLVWMKHQLNSKKIPGLRRRKL